jgi:hypothetical protein
LIIKDFAIFRDCKKDCPVALIKRSSEVRYELLQQGRFEMKEEKITLSPNLELRIKWQKGLSATVSNAEKKVISSNESKIISKLVKPIRVKHKDTKFTGDKSS